jgi:diguanylate cyclase (GGDEF)-like protein/PAS domain S-box-containing protein
MAKNRTTDQSLLSLIARILLLAGCYFAVGQASFSLSVSYTIITPVVFAAEGFSLAFVILWGKRLWTGVFLGQLALALYNGLPWQLALGVSIINSFEAVIGALLFHRLAIQPSFAKMRDILALLLLIFFVLQPFSATLGTLLLWLGNVVASTQFTDSWFSWWFGNSLGQALIAPLLLSFFADKNHVKQKLHNVLWLMLLIVPISVLTLSSTSFPSSIIIVFAITALLLILIAAKGGTAMVGLATVIVTVTTLLITRQMTGVFVHNGVILLTDLNIYLLGIILTGQLMATLLTEYNQVRLAQQKVAAQLQQIADHFPGIIYQFRQNPDGSFCFPYASQGMQAVYRFSPEEVQENADKVFAILHPEDYDLVIRSITHSAQQLTPWQCDYRVRFADGTVRWLSGHSLPQREQDGAILWHGFIKDVTEVKQKEIEYQNIIESSFSGFWCNDFSGRFLNVNTALCNMLGYTEQELLNMGIMDIEALENPDDVAAHIQTIIQTGHDRFESRHKHKDGRLIDVEISVLYMEELGQRFFVFVNDVTERKQTETQLRQSEQNFCRLIENAPVAIAFVHNDGRAGFVNERFSKLFGYTVQDIPTIQDWWQCAYPDPDYRQWVFDNWLDMIEKARATNSDIEAVERNVTCKDGSVKVMLNSGINFADGWIIIFIDITERKQMENALKASEAFTISILNSLTEHITVLDHQGDIIMVNQAWRQFGEQNGLSVTRYNYLQVCQNALQESYQENVAKTLQGIVAVLAGTLPGFHNEYPCHAPDEQRWFRITVSPLQGARRGVVISHENITKRKQVENALFNNQVLLQTAQRAARMGHYVTDSNAATWTNDALFDEIFGIEAHFERDCANWLALILPEDGQLVRDYFMQIIQNQEIFPNMEYRITRPCDGIVRWIAVWGHNTYDENGNLIQQVGMIQDITERKLVEQRLQESEERLSLSQEYGGIGSWEADLTNNKQIWSRTVHQLLKFPALSNPTWEDFLSVIHPDDRQSVIDANQAHLKQGKKYDVEYRAILTDGQTHWMRSAGQAQFSSDGTPVKFIGIVHDITERKLAEQRLQKTTEQLQLVLEGGHLGFWDWNIVTGDVQRNAIWADMLGYTQDEIEHSAKQWEDFVYIDDRKKARQSIHDVLEGRKPCHEIEYRMLHKDGSIRWVLDHASIVQRDANGKPTRMSGTHTDITKLKTLEEKLRESENFFSSLAQVNPVGIYRTDAAGNCIFVNPKACEIIGMTPEQAQGNGWRDAIMASDREKVYSEWQAAVQEHRQFTLEYRIQQANGKIIWVYGQATVIYDKAEQISGYVGTITDITERKVTEDYINHLAFYDPLTLLPNRRLLQERLKHAIEIDHRTHNKIAILMMDLDKFKAVNDNLGHAAGDELLKQVAERIKIRLREADTVARLGGDEFVILVEDVTHDSHIARIAEDVIHALAQPFTLYERHEVYIGTSIGIAIHPQHGNSVETLMDNADTALYHAKAQGRGCFAYFSETLTQKARERIALETQLRRAIEQQELRVYFQPQIDINSGRIVAAEALVRWHDPVHGCLMPSHFIGLAEESGLIAIIGEWVLRETCKLGRQWLDHGLPALTLAVNVSPYQFARHDINSLVTEILAETGFPADYLELEITESGLMENQDHAMFILNALHKQGVHLAIDDFGTGYSSLAYLKYFPVDVLKIDKTFIDDIPFLEGDMTITATIISMAHHLGFKVLAEGVETPEQLAFLREQGCDRYQGFLYSKALPAEDFVRLLAKCSVLTS